MAAFHPAFEDLPPEIAVFPLAGALLLPRSRLPLNIFEKRYLAMTLDSLADTGRMFGMIQPRPGAPAGETGPAGATSATRAPGASGGGAMIGSCIGAEGRPPLGPPGTPVAPGRAPDSPGAPQRVTHSPRGPRMADQSNDQAPTPDANTQSTGADYTDNQPGVLI